MPGKTASFTLTVGTGSSISQTVGGTCVKGTLVGNIYTTGIITSACTVIFGFDPIVTSYTVQFNIGKGGTITGNTSIPSGATASFTVTPDPGYVIDSVTGCNGNLLDDTFTISSMSGSCTITAVFKLGTYSVSPTVSGVGGTISPSTVVSVTGLDTVTFTLRPNTGYAVFSVNSSFAKVNSATTLPVTPMSVTVNALAADVTSVCTGTLSGNTYTTAPIVGNCTVTAMFAPISATSAPTTQSVPTLSKWALLCLAL
jgi:hypothetical protein